MLALRSILLIDARGRGAPARGASQRGRCHCDRPRRPHLARIVPEARRLARRHIAAVAKNGRPVYVRVSDTRSGELDDDLNAIVSASVTAIILTTAEVPQDARDVDVAIRRFEMERSLMPGGILVLPEIDSAEGVLALPSILGAIDRAAGVLLTLVGLQHDMRLSGARRRHLRSRDGGRSDGGAHGAHPLGARRRRRLDGTRLRSRRRGDRERSRGAGRQFAVHTRPRRGGNRAGHPRRLAATAREGQLSAGVDGRLIDRRAARRARALVELADAIDRRACVR